MSHVYQLQIENPSFLREVWHPIHGAQGSLDFVRGWAASLMQNPPYPKYRIVEVGEAGFAVIEEFLDNGIKKR